MTGHRLDQGHYRFDNTLIHLPAHPSATDPARINAVVDWELSTLGDPLADLALALVYWHDLGDTERELIPVALGVTAHEGFPTALEFAHDYATRTGRDLGQLPFHLGLAAMKLAAILEGVHARHTAGHTVSGGYGDMSEAVPTLVTRGLRWLGLAD
jgi:aminoglycoside phosphotransferase (APT) family kinase protein